jgi:superfamily II DNA/RNA helicase
MAARRPHLPHTPASPSFAALGVPGTLVDQLAAGGITDPLPIQSATLPDALAARFGH